MPRVMLILGGAPLDRSVAERAIREARSSKQTLVIVSVLDRARSETVASRLLETGQIGPRPSEGVIDSLRTRREQLVLDQAQEIADEAAALDVDAREVVRHGEYATAVTEVISKERPDTLVIPRRRRQFLRCRVDDTFLDTLQGQVGFRLIEL